MRRFRGVRVRRIPGTFRNRGRTLFVLPEIADDAPDAIKNAVAIRNACATEGRCPACGVVPDLTWQADGIGHLTFQHESHCPCLRDDEAST